MTREEWAELYDKLEKRQRQGTIRYTHDRHGATHQVFWPAYSAKQNRRWFMDQLKRKGLIDDELQ